MLFVGIPAARMVRDCSTIQTQLHGLPSPSEIENGRRVVTIVGASPKYIIRVLRELHSPSLDRPLIDNEQYATNPRSIWTYQKFMVFDAATALGSHTYIRSFRSILSEDSWASLRDLKKLVKYYGVGHAHGHIAAYRLVSRVVRYGDINRVVGEINTMKYGNLRELILRLAAAEERIERDNRRYWIEQEAEVVERYDADAED